MTPIYPRERAGFKQVVFAKNQPEYIPLPALTDGLHVVTRWKLSYRERIMCFLRGDSASDLADVRKATPAD
jgi:hypothetical protein